MFSSKVSNSVNITDSSVNRLLTAKVLTQHEKYHKVLTIGQRLAIVASCISTREFSCAMQCLEKIMKTWEQGQQVAIQIVDLDHRGICDPAVNLYHCDINNPPIDFDHRDICDPAVNLTSLIHQLILTIVTSQCDPAVNLDLN